MDKGVIDRSLGGCFIPQSFTQVKRHLYKDKTQAIKNPSVFIGSSGCSVAGSFFFSFLAGSLFPAEPCKFWNLRARGCFAGLNQALAGRVKESVG